MIKTTLFFYFLLSILSSSYLFQSINKKFLPKADYIQPWFCEYWTVEQWESHINKMISAGYSELIIQGSIDIRDTSIEIFYESAYFRIEAKKKKFRTS
jgi:hypothetical protein